MKNCRHAQIIPLFKYVLRQMRNRKFDIINIMEHVEKLYYDASNVFKGQVYIIDNIQTIKVGASQDARIRFNELKANGEIFPNASLVVFYDVADQNGFEAKAQAILNKYKAQNPLKSQNRNPQWGYLDEHFDCSCLFAYGEIEKNLGSQYKIRTII